MHTQTAYERRKQLTGPELERLEAALVDEIGRYLEAIRGYSPAKMERHGVPFLRKLEAKLARVRELRTAQG